MRMTRPVSKDLTYVSMVTYTSCMSKRGSEVYVTGTVTNDVFNFTVGGLGVKVVVLTKT